MRDVLKGLGWAAMALGAAALTLAIVGTIGGFLLGLVLVVAGSLLRWVGLW